MTFGRLYELRGMRNQMMRERNVNLRGPISRFRQVENNIDWPALTVQTLDLVDPDTGQFYFVPGFSVVGGGDIVRP